MEIINTLYQLQRGNRVLWGEGYDMISRKGHSFLIRHDERGLPHFVGYCAGTRPVDPEDYSYGFNHFVKPIDDLPDNIREVASEIEDECNNLRLPGARAYVTMYNSFDEE